MTAPDLTQVAQPSNDLQYVIYAVAVAVVLVILGLAFIRAKFKSETYTGEERRISQVEGNVERFATVEKMIADLTTQVAVLAVEVKTVNSNLEKMENRLEKMEGRFSELESRLVQHILDEERRK